MPRNFKLETSSQMGQKVVGVNITGDRKNQEPETFRISFPFGHVEVTRATDDKTEGKPDYWIHVYVNHRGGSNYCPNEDAGEYAGPGAIKAARLDQVDRSSVEADLGDFERPQLYHLAVRIGAVGE